MIKKILVVTLFIIPAASAFSDDDQDPFSA